MNTTEFMQMEKFKAITSVITLISKLSEHDSRMTFPVKQEKRVRVDLNLWNDLFLLSDKSIYHISQNVRDSSWKLKEKPLFNGKHYSCLTSFIVDGIKYTAAGYGKNRYRSASFGIDITNLADDETGQERKNVTFNLDSNRGFDGVGILRGDTVYDVSIVGSHPEAGIIKVPLEELVEKDTLAIDPTNIGKYTLYENPNKQQHAPLKVHKNKLYLGQDKTVVVLGATGTVEAEMEVPIMGNIKVIEVDDEGNIFSGTDNGIIYRNQSSFYVGKELRSITKVCWGKLGSHEGLFFTGEMEHGGVGPVLFKEGTGGKPEEACFIPGLIDFGYRGSISSRDMRENIIILTSGELIVGAKRVTISGFDANLRFKTIYVGGS